MSGTSYRNSFENKVKKGFVPNYVAGLNVYRGTYATVITVHIIFKIMQRGLSLLEHLEL